MPLVLRVDDLRVPHQPVAEVVDYGGNGEDATQTFIKSWFCHDFVLLWVCVLDRYSSREPTISGIQALRNLFSPTDGPLKGNMRKVTSLLSDPCYLSGPPREVWSSRNSRLSLSIA